MKKRNYLLFLFVLFSIIFSSCGVFHKSCNCPHFGKVKSFTRMYATRLA